MQYPLQSLHSNTIPLQWKGTSQPVLQDTSTIHSYAIPDTNPSHPSSAVIHNTLDTSGSSPMDSTLHSLLLHTPSQMDATHHSHPITLTFINSFTLHLSLTLSSKHFFRKSANSDDLMVSLLNGDSNITFSVGKRSLSNQ